MTGTGSGLLDAVLVLAVGWGRSRTSRHKLWIFLPVLRGLDRLCRGRKDVLEGSPRCLCSRPVKTSRFLIQ